MTDPTKLALVTGANTGIGRETALELAKRGHRVILACRSKERAEPVLAEISKAHGSESVDFLRLDLASLAQVKEASEEVLQRFEKLPLLINNAGLAGKRGQTNDGFELAFGVNHLGHFLFTLNIMPSLLAAKGARVVNVASIASLKAKGINYGELQSKTKTTTGLPEYQVSKLSNVLFSAELARRYTPEQLTSYSLHPGVVASDVWRNIPRPFSSIMKLFMISNAEGAQTSIHCATQPVEKLSNGRYYDECKLAEAHPLIDDAGAAKELWERSLEWVKPHLLAAN